MMSTDLSNAPSGRRLIATAISLCSFAVLASCRATSATRTYDVRDLVEPMIDHPAPELGVHVPTKEVDDTPGSVEDSDRDRASPSALLEQLAEWIRDGGTDDVRPERVTVTNEGLQVVGSAEAHASIERRLADLRRDADPSFDLEFLALDLSEEDAESWSIDPLEPTAPDSPAVEALIARLGEARKRELPKVVARSGQRTHSLIVHQAAISTMPEVVDEDGRKSLRPVIGILSTGVVVEVEPESVDSRNVDVQVAIQIVDCAERRAVMASSLDDYRGIDQADRWPIEVPELSRSDVASLVRAPLERWVLVGGTRGKIPIPGSESAGNDENVAASLIVLRATRTERGGNAE